MLQVELFNYSDLNMLKKAQNAWFKDMTETYDEFKIIEFKQSGEPDFSCNNSAKNVLVSIYYTVS